jgi:hypothetical protein
MPVAEVRRQTSDLEIEEIFMVDAPGFLFFVFGFR